MGSDIRFSRGGGAARLFVFFFFFFFGTVTISCNVNISYDKAEICSFQIYDHTTTLLETLFNEAWTTGIWKVLQFQRHNTTNDYCGPEEGISRSLRNVRTKKRRLNVM